MKRALLILLCVFAVAVSQAKSNYEIAKAYADSMMYAEVVRYTSLAVQEDNTNLDAYFLRGMAYAVMGNLTLANQDLTVVIKRYGKLGLKDNTLADAYYYRGLVYAKGENPDKALVEYNLAISTDDRQTRYYNIRGMNYARREDYSTALKDFRKSYALDSTNAETLENLGQCLYRLARYEEADIYFTKLVYTRNYSNGCYWKSVNDYALGLYDSAIQWHIFSLRPYQDEDLEEFFVICSKDPEWAIERIEVQLDKEQDDYTRAMWHYSLARIYYSLGQKQQALTHCKKSIVFLKGEGALQPAVQALVTACIPTL